MMARQLWFPAAIKDPIVPWTTTGAFANDANTNDTKFVVHRTQGDSYPRSTYARGGGVPHWTILHSGVVYQHYPINQFSRALLNMRGGVQTNLDQALQVELVGFTGRDMSPQQLKSFVMLKDWIVANTSMPDVWLGGDPSQGPKLSRRQWDDGTGIVPHLKVPENNHTDTITRNDWLVVTGQKEAEPMAVFKFPYFQKDSGVLLRKGSAYRREVKDLQKAVNELAVGVGPIAVDGGFGPATERGVKALQSTLGVSGDGVWGDGSHEALRARVYAKPVAVAPVVPVPEPAPAPVAPPVDLAALEGVVRGLEGVVAQLESIVLLVRSVR